MERVYKNCQSCGMPMKRDERGGGTNADGSRNAMYCSHCYEAGRFTVRNITVEDMKVQVRGKLKAVGFPGFVASFF
ncbi:MAG: zinc ribbon domain-containing protein, partial [Niastella sp.]|nr:zinc ribbon domain-containing protein [Niastella sp.]